MSLSAEPRQKSSLQLHPAKSDKPSSVYELRSGENSQQVMVLSIFY